MINPSRIIQDKANTLSRAAGEFGSNLQTNFSTLTQGARSTFAQASNQISVLENSFANADIAGSLGNGLNRFTSGLADFKDAFPPALNNIAGGFGAVANKFTDQIENILPGEISSLTGALDQAFVDLENTVVGQGSRFITPVKFAEELLSLEESQSQLGSTYTPEVYPKGPGVALKNQLEAYASYNCIFTLGVLASSSVNDPAQTYRQRGADFTILRSGGGGIDENRIQTAYDALGSEAGNLEYFIDDFEMDSILSTSKAQGATQAMEFSFKVYEPYSMGLFLQALQAAAFDAGYQNYLQAPYMLELDFIGWNDNGEREPIQFSNRKLPFKLLEINFDVERGGSTYEVRCIPWNEAALMNEIVNIQDSVEITGDSVLSCLSSGAQGLATTLNNKLQEVAQANGLPASDFYLIRFPSQRDSGSLNLSDTAAANSATTTDLEDQRSLRSDANELVSGNIDQFFANIGIDSNTSSLVSSLKGSAISDLNPIGASRMVETVNAGGDSPFGLGIYTYNTDTEVYERDGVELTIDGSNRTFKFQQGMSITRIIEEIILISNYGSYALNRVNDEGMIPWFKIEPKVYVVDNPDHENVTGRTAKVYVYDVVRYDVNVSQFSAPNKTTVGNVNLARQAVKSYNYIYSGKNTDVLGFDIKFNAAFFEAVRADINQLSSAQVQGAANTSVAEAPPATQTLDSSPGGIPEGQTQATSSVGFTSNNFNSSAAINLAKNLHNTLLNSDVDLITADLEIWGDPYYIPDSGVGNYTAGPGPSINITADGSIDHQRSEVDIIINFRTPIDYSTESGLMEFPGDTIPVDSFSGLYKILGVTTSISGNKFTQSLNLVRRKNQSTEGISTAKVFVEQPNATSLNPNERPLAERIGVDPSELENRSSTVGATGPVRAPIGENGELVTITTKSGRTTQVAKIVAANFQALIDELEDDYGYEIRTLGGYANRAARGSGSPSYHASGLAIDINAAENGMIRPRPAPYPNNEPTDMPEAGDGSVMKALAEKHGLGWGGAWRSAIDAMHFSAARAEGGSLTWARNGLIPKAPEQEQAESTYDDAILRRARQAETPPQAPDTNNAGSGLAPVAPIDSLPPGERARWTSTYGATHNPDGTPRTITEQTVDDQQPTVSGTQSTTAPPVTSQAQASAGPANPARPYFPSNPLDDLYKFQRGEKVKALARFYTQNYTQTTVAPPTTDTETDPDANDPRRIGPQ